MSKVIYRTVDGNKGSVYYGQKFHLRLSGGRKLLDMSSSAGFACLGYTNPYIKNHIEEQLWNIPYAFSGFWSTDTAERAAERIAEDFDKVKPGWFGKCIFLQTGSEAVDLACKLTVQCHMEAGEQRLYFIARDHSFHGVGLLPSMLSGKYPRYGMLDPYHQALVNGGDNHVTHCWHPYDKGSKESLRCMQDSSMKWTAAIIVEPVSGPSLGAYVEIREYMQGLRDICDQNGSLLIYDEVLCGAGRCGYMSTAEMYGVWPDIVILGKAISAGYQPVSVICLSEKVVDRIRKGSGRIMFGTTYSAHTMGCAAVEATLAYIRANDLMKKVRGDRLLDKISDYLDLPVVKDVRGTGHLIGIEFRDPATDRFFDPEIEFYAKARDAIMALGAVVYAKGGTVWGKGDFMTVMPPYEMDDETIDQGLSMVRQGIETAYEQVKK